VLQAYDSVRVNADVEIGGTDQTFNCLCGRELQRSFGHDPQVVVTVPLLMGTDGRKMSKSFDNHIAVMLEPREIVGRVMSIPDELLDHYATLATDWDARETLKRGANPRDVKLAIAESIATQLHGGEAARAAISEFVRVFSAGGRPDSIPRHTVHGPTIGILDLLVDTGCASSRSEARRLIEQGGVRVDGGVVDAIEHVLDLEGDVVRLVQVGKRRFVEVSGDA
jgi:tyrosyl-tRNA synthetase